MSDGPNQLAPIERPAAVATTTAANGLLRELAAMSDIPLRVSIEVGRIKLSVGEFLRLGEGTIFEVKKPAGEPFEVCLNGCLVAKGEVIVVEQSSGVRIVEVLKPAGGA